MSKDYADIILKIWTAIIIVMFITGSMILLDLEIETESERVKTKTEFIEYAKEFEGDYGMALKWLMDFKKGLLSDKRPKSGLSRLEYLISKFPFTLTGVNSLRPNSLVSRLWAKSISRRP